MRRRCRDRERPSCRCHARPECGWGSVMGPGTGTPGDRAMTILDVVREASAAEVGLSADECLKCNVCNTVCPVSRVTDLFPGPKYVGPQAQRFRLATALPVQGPLTPLV